MPDNTLIFSPILNSNTSHGMHYFKIGYRDVLELRVVKDDLMKRLIDNGFDVKDMKGWYE